MLLAQIKSLGKLTPITPGSSGDFRAKSDNKPTVSKVKNSQGQTTFEKGKAWIKINPLNEVDINDILEVYILGITPIKGKVIAQNRSFLKGQEIEVYFEESFESGFSSKMNELIYPGGGLIGFTSFELRNLENLEFQKRVSDILIDFMLSEHTEEIKKISLPCYTLSIMDDCESKSHFCGLPKFGFQRQIPINAFGQPLYHLGTFNSEEVSKIYQKYTNYELLNNLSFYIDIQNTENGWPVESDSFKVLTYSSIEERVPDSVNCEKEKTINFKSKLDFPHPHHSALEKLNLDNDEIKRYDAFRCTFNYILDHKDLYNYKLFGYPDLIERCVSFEAERLKSNKAYMKINWETSSNWMLLLQISPLKGEFDFFKDFGSGMIYFMIKKNDLKRGSFDDVQVVVQTIPENFSTLLKI